MKKSSLIIITLLIALFMFQSLFAQNTEIQEIQYQHSINMHATMTDMLNTLGDDENSEATQVMERVVPKNDVYNTSLFFDGEQAVIQDRSEGKEGLLGNFMNNFPLSYTMMDKSNQKSIAFYFDEKGNFRTERPLEAVCELELVEEEKIILGYPCRKAIWTPEKQSAYVVWYAPQLPAGFSSIGYVPVPGLVLAAESETISVIATNIQDSSWPVDLTDRESFELLTYEEVNERIFELMKGSFEIFDFMDSVQEIRDELQGGKN